MSFRSTTKEPVPGQAPIPIVDQIRARAAAERRSHSSVVSELLCVGLGIDPANFGIVPKPPRKRTTSSSPN